MSHQPKSNPLALGALAPDFCLPGTDGQEHRLSREQGTKGTVIAFMCNHCPYVKAYDGRFNVLAKAYQPKGITFFAINANDVDRYQEDGVAKMQEKSRRLQLAYAYLRDESQQVPLDYGAGCTPEFFVFNAGLQLVYTGRLDDHMEDPAQVRQHYLRDALEAVLAGRVPAVPQSHAIGCSIKWK